MADGRGRLERRARVGDLRQLASVRRIVLDDGPERGVRALAFSTGGGLDFWVLTDRSFDLGPVWHEGVPVAWQSPMGFRSPALHVVEQEGGRGFERSFSGFLMTCGLEHVRQPAEGRPLHGHLPVTPGRLLAYGEDWDAAEPVLFCEGEMVQARYTAEALRLRRRIEAPIGGRALRLVDTVENLAGTPFAPVLLYHFNFGHPAIATGTEVRFGETRLLGPITLPDPADPPLAEDRPAGTGTAIARVLTGRFEASVAFATDTLPYLQVWRDLRPHAGVLSVEPCTHARGADAPLPAPLAPGERRQYRIEVGFTGRLAP